MCKTKKNIYANASLKGGAAPQAAPPAHLKRAAGPRPRRAGCGGAGHGGRCSDLTGSRSRRRAGGGARSNYGSQDPLPPLAAPAAQTFPPGQRPAAAAGGEGAGVLLSWGSGRSGREAARALPEGSPGERHELSVRPAGAMPGMLPRTLPASLGRGCLGRWLLATRGWALLASGAGTCSCPRWRHQPPLLLRAARQSIGTQAGGLKAAKPGGNSKDVSVQRTVNEETLVSAAQKGKAEDAVCCLAGLETVPSAAKVL